MNFDFENMEARSFGVATRVRGEVSFFNIQSDNDVLEELEEMAKTTWEQMLEVDGVPIAYDPSEAYPAKQHLTIGLQEEPAGLFWDLHQAVDLNPGGREILDNPRTTFCYFARFIDANGRQLVAMRRSSTFKGAVTRQARGIPHRLMIWRNGLMLIEGNVFRLDPQFDLLIDNQEVRILHTAGFEQIGGLRTLIQAAAIENVQYMQVQLPFVARDFDDPEWRIPIGIARKLAALRQVRLEGLTADSLRRQCAIKNVPFNERPDGTLEFEQAYIGDLLDVLTRHIFVDELIPGEPEVYRAPSRRPR